jgi:hypothetical protein
MKNIFLIPTDQPSRLYKKLGRELKYSIEYFEQNGLLCINQNIYITSDEKIKEGFVFNTFNNTVYKIVPNNSSREMLANPFILPLCAINKEHYFKLILTTDKDLIKNGVQAIDDEFLEWFVKNPSCEEVEVQKFYGFAEDYLIIIPKEELINCPKCRTTDFKNCHSIRCPMRKEEPKQFTTEMLVDLKQGLDNTIQKSNPLFPNYKHLNKQETLEEYISEVTKNFGDEMSIKFTSGGIKLGAKWQAERMYSEEALKKELKQAFLEGHNIYRSVTDNIEEAEECFEEWFEQFKKK